MERGVSRPRCHTCSEPHDADQEYCLECGARLPAAPRQAAEPPLWAWATVVMLAMVAIVSGIVVALLASADEGVIVETRTVVAQPASPVTPLDPVAQPAAPQAAPIEPPVTVPIEGSASDLLSPDDQGSAPDPVDSSPALVPDDASTDPGAGDLLEPGEPEIVDGQPAPGAGSLEGWPPGTEGFTVILASIPQSSGRAEGRFARPPRQERWTRRGRRSALLLLPKPSRGLLGRLRGRLRDAERRSGRARPRTRRGVPDRVSATSRELALKISHAAWAGWRAFLHDAHERLLIRGDLVYHGDPAAELTPA